MIYKKEEFLESLEEQSACQGMARLIFGKIEKHYSKDITLIKNKNDVVEIFLAIKTNRISLLTSYLSIIKKYYKFIGAEECFKIIESLTSSDKKEIHKTIKEMLNYSSIITSEEFDTLIKNINQSDLLNISFYIGYLRCLWEGVNYSNQLYSLIHLKKSDINFESNTINIEIDDILSYKLRVSDELINILEELANTKMYSRTNRQGTYDYEVKGLANDSCFKFYYGYSEKIPNFYLSFYNKIKTIEKNFKVDLSPFKIYSSGIVSRIQKRLPWLSVSEIFNNSGDRAINAVITKELKRCGYQGTTENFKKTIVG